MENDAVLLEKINQDLISKQDKLSQVIEKTTEKEEELREIKESPGYISQEMISRERSEINELVRKNDEQIVAFFTKLRPLILEYLNFGFKREFINSYLDNPLKAFKNDDSLAIRTALQHMKEILKNGKFSFSFKEANKVMETLEREEIHLEEFQ